MSNNISSQSLSIGSEFSAVNKQQQQPNEKRKKKLLEQNTNSYFAKSFRLLVNNSRKMRDVNFTILKTVHKNQ